MIKERIWYCGFRMFYAIRHPRFVLFKFWRTCNRKVLNNKNIVPDGYLLPKNIPKKIWIYWEQEWDKAPELVKLCLDSWVAHNPDWEVIQLGEKNLSKYITIDVPLQGREITRTGYSNIVRLTLLEKYGGVWVDATTFCTAPLDSWLPYLMQTGFFVFHKPKTTVASWFIAAEQNHELICCWKEYVKQYWKFTRKPDIYFWVQYLFEYMILHNIKMRTIWSQTPHINTDGPYAVQRCLKRGAPSEECVDMVFSGKSPVHKLSWKIDIPDTFLHLLRQQLQNLSR